MKRTRVADYLPVMPLEAISERVWQASSLLQIDYLRVYARIRSHALFLLALIARSSRFAPLRLSRALAGTVFTIKTSGEMNKKGATHFLSADTVEEVPA